MATLAVGPGYSGDIDLGDTIHIKFTTVGATGVPTQLAGSPTISAYPGTSDTQITAGITLTIDKDGVTGLNDIVVVATSGNGYAAATNYALVLTGTGTVGAVSVTGYVVATFSISARSALTRAEATSDVNQVLTKLMGLVLVSQQAVGSTGNDTTHVNLDGLTHGDDQINDLLLIIYDASTDTSHARWITDWDESDALATVATLPFTPGASDLFWLLSIRRDGAGTGSTLTAIPWNAAWDAEVESEVNDALVVQRLDELLNADSDIDGASPPTVGSVFFELMTKTTGSFTFVQTDDSLEAIRDRGDAAWGAAGTGIAPSLTGTLTGTPSTTVVQDTVNLTQTEVNFWKGAGFRLTNGPSAGVPRLITGFNPATDQLTLDPALPLTPEAGNAYEILPDSGVDVRLWAGSANAPLIASRVDVTVGAMQNNVVTAAAMATDCIGSDEIAATAVTELQTGLATSAEIAAVQSDTNDIQARIPAALVSGRMNSHVNVMASGVITDTAFASGAITSDAFAGGAIDANAIATDAVSKITAGVGPQKNQALPNIQFLMLDSTDHVTPKTGLTVSGTRSLDSGAFEAVSGTIAPLSDGIYQFDALAADMNGNSILFKFTATGADTRFLFIPKTTPV